ncbi:hypothetical protein EMIT0P218_60310 [Pseudomonas sp. IT-P218]
MAVSLPLWVMLLYTCRTLENQDSTRQSVIEQHKSNDTCGPDYARTTVASRYADDKVHTSV